MITYNDSEVSKQADKYVKDKHYRLDTIVRDSFEAGFKKGIETQLSDDAVKTEWISVTNDKPQDLERVQVIVCDESGDYPYYYTTIAQYMGMWFDGEDYLNVIAWRPNEKLPPREILKKLRDDAS